MFVTKTLQIRGLIRNDIANASLASSRVAAGVLCLLCTWVPTPSSHLKSRRVQILGYSISQPEAMTNYPFPSTNVELSSSSHEIGPP